MNLTLDGIREGEYREITAQEWEELNHLLESSTSETVIRTGEQNGNSSDHANERAGAKAGQGSKGVLLCYMISYLMLTRRLRSIY